VEKDVTSKSTSAEIKTSDKKDNVDNDIKEEGDKIVQTEVKETAETDHEATDSAQEQTEEKPTENIVDNRTDLRFKEDTSKNIDNETVTKPEEAVTKPEEDVGTPVDLEVENELVGYKVDEVPVHLPQQHLYPDLSEQLQQFIKENELVTYFFLHQCGF
jgi:putative cell wall-binding protein